MCACYSWEMGLNVGLDLSFCFNGTEAYITNDKTRR
jgi:hypothetical protein